MAPTLLLLGSLASAQPGRAQPRADAVASTAPAPVPYAEIADLVLASPVILDATIRSAARIKGAEAIGVAADRVRFYVEADVAALVRGPGASPPRVGWLADVPLDPAGRAPRLKRQRVIAFARPVPGAAGQIQLVNPGAQRGWTPALDALVRQIAREVVAGDAPPAITGVGNAFHVPGSLPGEGETQVFLATADRRPVSLSILRRPGEERRWAVALSEIVDDAAGPPRRDTLLWYRLACGLPRALPAQSVASLSAEDATAAGEDYQFVLAQLGRCR